MKYFISLILFISTCLGVSGQCLVEFRGVGRTGIYDETGLLKSWPEEGPELLLKIEGVGKGYSQPVLYNNVIYVTGIKHDTMDVVSAYDMDGRLLWDRVYARSWIRTYPDTRSTPTIEDGKIYLAGGMGEVVSIDAKTGNILWSVNALKNYKGEYLTWGIAESVLLTDKAVIYTTGGELTSVVAFDKNNGGLLWKTKSLGGPMAYASSILINKGQLKIILAQTAKDLIAINADSGDILWNFGLAKFHPGTFGKGTNTNIPLYRDNEIFVTSGYNHYAVMLSMADDCKSVSLKWKNDTLDTHHGGVVLVDGNIYGSNWLNNSRGNWVSLDWDTGKVNWETKWFNKGSIISADGLLYCYEEKMGNLALVEPTPEEFRVISSFKINEGKGPHWAHPAIYDGKLFIRHGEVVMVFNVKA